MGRRKPSRRDCAMWAEISADFGRIRWQSLSRFAPAPFTQGSLCLIAPLSVLFPIGNFCTLATPQSANAAISPSRGAKGAEQPPHPPQTFAAKRCHVAPLLNLCREALPLLGEVPSAHTGERGLQTLNLEQRGKESVHHKLPCRGRPRAVPQMQRRASGDKSAHHP